MAYPADPLGLRVRIAPGYSITEDPAGYSWVDISTRVRTPRGRPTVSIAHGATQGVRETLPSGAELLGENADGFFGVRNPAGTYYGTFGKDTPLDIAVNPGTGWVTRFTGGLLDVPRETDMGGRNSWVTLTAQGMLGRLAQRGEPIKSAMTRYIERTADNGLLGYWPLEDAPNASRAAGVLIRRSDGSLYQTPPMPVNGTIRFGQTAPPSGIASLADPSNGFLATTFPVGTDAGEWRVQIFARGDIGSVTTQTRIASWNTRGTIIRWDLVANDGVVAVHGYDSTTAQLINTTVSFDADDGDLHYYWVDAYDNLGTLTVELWIDGTLVGSDTLAATTTSQPSYARVHPDREALALEVAGFGAWMPRPSSIKSDALLDVAFGMREEYADARIARLGDEEDIPISIGGSGVEQLVVPMGPQAVDTLLENFRLAESTGRGVLFDAPDGNVRYRPITDLENQTVQLSLSYTSRQTFDPLLPAEAGAMAVNDATTRNPDGTTAQRVDETAVNRDGRKSRTFDVNTAFFGQLEQIASWERTVGTWDEEWYDNVRMQLAHPMMSSKIAAWLDAEIGDRLKLTDLPLASHPQGTDPDLMLRGYTEEITLPRLWTVDANCAPYGPYQVGVIGTDKMQVGKTLTGEPGARLAAAASSSATSLSVAVGLTRHNQAIPRFTTDAGNYPTLMTVGGEHVNVTAMAAVPAITFVATGVASHADNASVTPALPGGTLAAGDLMLLFAAARNTGVSGTPTGWAQVEIPEVDFALFLKVHTGSESAPTVNFADGGAGNTCSAQITSFRGAFSSPGIRVRANGRENASAQNIAYPAMRIPKEHSGCLILYMGQKLDDWTGVTSPGTEISEPSSTLGSDQGLVWAFQIQTTPTDIAAGSFVVTGGAAAQSAGAVVALRCNVQTATVTRAVNRIVKAHAVGEGIELVSPIRLGVSI